LFRHGGGHAFAREADEEATVVEGRDEAEEKPLAPRGAAATEDR